MKKQEQNNSSCRVIFKRLVATGFFFVVTPHYISVVDAKNTHVDDSDSPLSCALQSDGSSVVCQFRLTQKEQSVSLNSCLEDFCVEATVRRTLLKSPKQKESVLPSSLPLPDIVVGETSVYRPPYQQYEFKIARVLQKYPRQRNGGVWSSALKEADWYTQLGLAHRSVAEDQIIKRASKTASFSKATSINNHIRQAVTALQQAARLYQGMRVNNGGHGDGKYELDESEDLEVLQLLAATYFQIGESFALAVDDTKLSALANDYIVQAEKLYSAMYALVDKRPNDDADNWLEEEKWVIRISWALCRTRLGAILFTAAQAAEATIAENISVDDLMDSFDDVDWYKKNEPIQDLQGVAQLLNLNNGGGGGGGMGNIDSAALQAVTGNTAQAKYHFEQAALTFREALHRDRTVLGGSGGIMLKHYPSEDITQLKRDLALVLQNLGSVCVMLGEFEEGIKHSEEALKLYEEEVTPRHGSLELIDTRIAIAELLYSLSDSYLQLGKYETSHDRYRQAMQWFEKYNISPPVTAKEGTTFTIQNYKEAIESYEELLEDYNDLLSGNIDVVEYPNDIQDLEDSFGRGTVEPDFGYEGDIHAGLGAIYMTIGDLLQAKTHFTQAVSLYEKSGEEDELSLADAKYNLAILQFRSSLFAESAELYKEALYLWKMNVDEGTNPITQVRLSTVQKSFARFSLGDIQGPDDDFDESFSKNRRNTKSLLADGIESESKSAESKKKGTFTDGNIMYSNQVKKTVSLLEKDVTKTASAKTSRAIDLDAYMQSLLNQTKEDVISQQNSGNKQEL